MYSNQVFGAKSLPVPSVSLGTLEFKQIKDRANLQLVVQEEREISDRERARANWLEPSFGTERLRANLDRPRRPRE